MGHSDDNEAVKIKANDESVYYSGVYWNDYKSVRDEINKRVSGKPNVLWYDYFQRNYKNRIFEKALILNCGNGWVERLLYKKDLFRRAVGVDYSEQLVAESRKKAGNRPLEYYIMDINTAEFPETGFDLVVNHASAHHIANIDKVFRAIASIMTPTGMFVSFDYVGPHRNQYPLKQWIAAYRINKQLPPHMRQDMRYPHLPTMLVNDPSEAVHAELILTTMKRYFDIVEHKQMGGSIAYLLLTHNQNFQKASRADVEKWSKFIMSKDVEYLNRHPNSSMFDYFVALPGRHQPSQAELDKFTKAESLREETSHKHSNIYYRLNFMQKRTIAKEEKRLKRLASVDKRKARKLKWETGIVGDIKNGLATFRREGVLLLIRKFLFSPSKRPSLQTARYVFLSTLAICSTALATAFFAKLFETRFQYAILLGGVTGLLVSATAGALMSFSSSVKRYLRPRFFSVMALGLSLLFFALGSAAIVQGSTISKTKGLALTYDEISLLPNGYYYRQYGKYFLNPEHPPLVKFIAAAAFTSLDPTPARDFPKEILLEDYAQYGWGKEFLFDVGNNTEQIILRARLSVLAVNSVLLFVLFISIANAWSRRAGFIALLFIVSSQYFIAHASLVTVDFMPSVFSMLTLIWFTIWAQRFKAAQSTRWPLILTSIFLAGALLSKFSTILLLPTLVVAALVYMFIVRKDLHKRRIKFSLSVVGTMALSLVLIVGFYTWHVRSMSGEDIVAQLNKSYNTERMPEWGLTALEKVTNFGIIGRAFTEFAHGILMVNNRIYKGAGGVYFMDQFYGTEGAGPWYFVVLYFTKLQLLFLLTNVFVLIGGVWLIIRTKGKGLLRHLGRYPLPAVVGLYALIFGSIAIASTLQIGLRHIMPSIMGAMIIVALGLDVGLTKIRRRFGKRIVMFGCVLFASLLLINTFRSYPYYLSSYNILAGGTKDGHKVAVDSNYDWGQDMKLLAKWQQENKVDKIYADVFTNPFLPLSYYLGPKVERYNISVDSPLQPGSYLAVSATKFQTNTHRNYAPEQSYRQYEDDIVARVGTSIFVYKVPGK